MQVSAISAAVSVLVVMITTSITGAQLGEVIGDGMIRFDASHEARLKRRPSIAMVQQFESIGDIDASTHPLTPEFSRNEAGRYIAHIDLEEGTSLYGTGEVAGPLLRNGFVTETWNLDAFGYGLDAKTRLLVTLAGLVAAGATAQPQIALTVRHAREAEASEKEIAEVIYQMSMLGGLPAMNRALEIAKEVFEDLNEGGDA